MTDTPLTDAELAGVDWFVTDSDQRAVSWTDYECLADFARQLERERNELLTALKDCTDDYEEAAQYKGDYLSTKHGDAESIAKYRAIIKQAKGD